MPNLDGRVAIVTGAARGLGRAHAIEMAREGARLVLNDLDTGKANDHDGLSETAALVAEAGGAAATHHGDCAEWRTGAGLLELALQTFGELDIVVNNAGIIRDRMPFNMSEQEWDDVIRVNLKGHFTVTRHSCEHWRSRFKAGHQVSGRIINTTSAAGLWGSSGQPNYAAAKAGIVGLTWSLANAMRPYGVTVNAIAPLAETQPEVHIHGLETELRARLRPDQVSAMVAYLASKDAGHISGQVFHVAGGRIDRVEGFRIAEGLFKPDISWTVDELVQHFAQVLIPEGPSPQDALSRILTSGVEPEDPDDATA